MEVSLSSFEELFSRLSCTNIKWKGLEKLEKLEKFPQKTSNNGFGSTLVFSEATEEEKKSNDILISPEIFSVEDDDYLVYRYTVKILDHKLTLNVVKKIPKMICSVKVSEEVFLTSVKNNDKESSYLLRLMKNPRNYEHIAAGRPWDKVKTKRFLSSAFAEYPSKRSDSSFNGYISMMINYKGQYAGFITIQPSSWITRVSDSWQTSVVNPFSKPYFSLFTIVVDEKFGRRGIARSTMEFAIPFYSYIYPSVVYITANIDSAWGRSLLESKVKNLRPVASTKSRVISRFWEDGRIDNKWSNCVEKFPKDTSSSKVAKIDNKDRISSFRGLVEENVFSFQVLYSVKPNLKTLHFRFSKEMKNIVTGSSVKTEIGEENLKSLVESLEKLLSRHLRNKLSWGVLDVSMNGDLSKLTKVSNVEFFEDDILEYLRQMAYC